MKKIFVLVPVLALIFCIIPRICSADSHSGEIFFYSGIDNITDKKSSKRNLKWYVRQDSIKMSDNRVRAGGLCFAYDENNKWVWTEEVRFSVVIKNESKYRIVREINGYEMGNFTKRYKYVKKDTMYGALFNTLKEYIDFGTMVPIEIE